MLQSLDQYFSPKAPILAVSESVLLGASVLSAIRLRFWHDRLPFDFGAALPEVALQTVGLVAVTQLCFYFNDLYNMQTVRGYSQLLIRVGRALTISSLLLGLLYYWVPALSISRGVFLASMAVAGVLVVASRVCLDAAWRATGFTERVLILGGGDLAQAVSRELRNRDDLPFKAAGLVLANGANSDPGQMVWGLRVLGSTEDLEKVVEEHRISRIIVAIQDRRGQLQIRPLFRLKAAGIQVEEAQTVLSRLTGRVWLEGVRPSWFVFSDGFRRSALTAAGKRAMDVFCATVGLIFAVPIALVVILAIKLDSRGPVLYRQRRVGYREKLFEVLKFRSMSIDAEADGVPKWAQQDDPRVTRVGYYLRKFRLDELPQFVNVLRGEMSFVGPRPERPEFVEKLRQEVPFYDERHSVRPGITGWAQVEYRYGATVEDAIRKLEYDLFYLKNMSLLFDAVIVLKTLRIVLIGHGAR